VLLCVGCVTVKKSALSSSCFPKRVFGLVATRFFLSQKKQKQVAQLSQRDRWLNSVLAQLSGAGCADREFVYAVSNLRRSAGVELGVLGCSCWRVRLLVTAGAGLRFRSVG